MIVFGKNVVLEYLNSNNVLIFSPNNIFQEYISNVLPELGEDHTLITTFHEFASKYIKEYWRVEPYSTFLARYYKNEYQNNDLIKFKLSDEIIPLLENYANTITKLCRFTSDIEYNEIIVDKNELNDLLQNGFDKFPLFVQYNLYHNDCILQEVFPLFYQPAQLLLTLL